MSELLKPHCWFSHEAAHLCMFQRSVIRKVNHPKMSRLVGKPTMWFRNRSDTNQAVQQQKQAGSLKFRI